MPSGRSGSSRSPTMRCEALARSPDRMKYPGSRTTICPGMLLLFHPALPCLVWPCYALSCRLPLGQISRLKCGGGAGAPAMQMLTKPPPLHHRRPVGRRSAIAGNIHRARGTTSLDFDCSFALSISRDTSPERQAEQVASQRVRSQRGNRNARVQEPAATPYTIVLVQRTPLAKATLRAAATRRPSDAQAVAQSARAAPERCPSRASINAERS